MKIHKKINLQGKWIYGCCMLPDGRLVFTYNRERKVRVFNNQGSKEFEMKIPCGAFDIVYISNDNTLVVTSGESDIQCLTVINLERKKIKKTISLSSDNYGIVLKDNQLIYSAFNKGIRMINLYDETLSDIVREEMASEGYIATFKDNIYHTHRLNHTVTCYNVQGEKQWTFKNEIILNNPLGIDVDSDEHNECKDIVDIDNVIKNVKSSIAFNEIQLTLSSMIEYIERVKKDREENLLSIKKQKEQIVTKILQARKDKPIPAKSIDDLTLMLVQSINTYSNNVKGCTMLPDGRMVFTCYHLGYVIVVNQDGSKAFEIKTGTAFDVVYVVDNDIAVTSGYYSQCFSLIDIESKNVKKTLNFSLH
ncbi:unnamed protein product [Mytilus edulis]|uniref:Uncharacterized protein n=1 Tax=Mytilus edulis TaxID=6550 RepID=A0A8S3VIX7_MYTED|nr:unnamed protein product [Mytilus edulis]